MSLELLKGKAKELQEIRDICNSLDEQHKAAKEVKDTIQGEMLDIMKENEMLSLKTEENTFSRTIKKDIKVTNEIEVIEYLENNGLTEFHRKKVDSIKFKTYAKSLHKGTGEIVPGTEQTESEYMSIKNNK